MGFWAKAKAAVITTLSVTSRVIYNGAQTFYSMLKVVEYFKGTGHPAATAATATAIIGTAGSTLLVKTVTTYDHITAASSQTDAARPPLKWGGWLADVSLRGSSVVYGSMNSVSAHFLTTTIIKSLDALVSSEPETAAWKEALIQLTGILIAGFTYYNYHSNDYRFIRENTRSIGESIDERHFALNKAMAKTLTLSSLNLVTFPAQAAFFAKPAIQGLPYVGKMLGNAGTNALTGAAAGVTFLTVVSWLPSVYKQFADTSHHEMHTVRIPANCMTISYKIASYVTGTIDSIGGNGLGPYISIIFAMNQLFGLNPYGWVIGFASLCGLNALVMNELFSVKAGTDTTLEILYRDNDPETRSLLRSDNKDPESLLPEGDPDNDEASPMEIDSVTPINDTNDWPAPGTPPQVRSETGTGAFYTTGTNSGVLLFSNGDSRDSTHPATPRVERHYQPVPQSK